MKKRSIALFMAMMLGATALGGCGEAGNDKSQEKSAKQSEASGEQVEITFYSTQAGVDNETVALLDEFTKENPDIKVEFLPCGDDQLQAWLGLYAAKKAPTVALMDVSVVTQYHSYFYNFSENEVPWVDDIVTGKEYYTVDGSLYAIPASVQGFGLMYNNRVLKEVFGEDFDIHSVDTRDELEKMLDDIDASGKAASTITLNADWALAAHLGALLYSGYQGDETAQMAFIDSLKKGEASLADDQVYNDLMDTLDILSEHNMNKADPLQINQEMNCEAFATGKVATYFQGDWNWMMMSGVEGRDEELGMIPLPISNDPEQNVGLPMSSPKGYCIDASQNTEEQQAAGIKLVEWLCNSEKGQDFMGVTIGSTLPFKDVKVENPNALAKSTQEYMEKGEIKDIRTFTVNVPSDYWYVVGPYFQQYVAGELDRQGLAKEIESYWTSLE